MDERVGQIAVIFSSQRRGRRNGRDEPGYAAAARAMEALAAEQPGYCGIVSARGADGFGITVSYWASDADARAWRDHPLHAAVRDQGRADWYDSHRVEVATIARGYGWSRG